MSVENFIGPRGRAQKLTINPELPGAATILTWWLLTGGWHPVWSQFSLSVMRLENSPGLPPATLQFPGATHELLVLALNPGDPPRVHAPDDLGRAGLAACGGYLEPVDVVHQFTATDDEMTQLAELCARACTDGRLNPSTDDGRTYYRGQWLTACVRTLAHMRGEEHAP